jgi:hypothetical protein
MRRSGAGLLQSAGERPLSGGTARQWGTKANAAFALRKRQSPALYADGAPAVVAVMAATLKQHFWNVRIDAPSDDFDRAF